MSPGSRGPPGAYRKERAPGGIEYEGSWWKARPSRRPRHEPRIRRRLTLAEVNQSLITTALLLLVVDVAAWVAAWLSGIEIVYAVAGALALATAVPMFLMFRRVKMVENDFGHREALSLAQRKETDRNQQAILRLLDELSRPRGR